MRPQTLADLDLAEYLDDVVGTAMAARAAAMQVRRTEGATARMQDLAALALGSLALLDVEVTAQAAAGLAVALSDVPSALPVIAAGLATAGDAVHPYWRERLMQPGRPRWSRSTGRCSR